VVEAGFGVRGGGAARRGGGELGDLVALLSLVGGLGVEPWPLVLLPAGASRLAF
jgi:hypothetical protein